MLNTRNNVEEVHKKLKPVFVYGTLRVKAEDKTVWELEGYQMRSTGKYPFIEYTGRVSDVVFGQVLELENEEHLAGLDRYEGVASGLYVRHNVTVRKDNGATTKQVQVYVKGPAFDYPVIKSGDWNQYILDKEKRRG